MKVKHLKTKTTIELTPEELYDWCRYVNQIDSMLDKLSKYYPEFPDVIVIKSDYDDSQIKSLYQQSDLLVAPSRGEGFGLPIAEAMLALVLMDHMLRHRAQNADVVSETPIIPSSK